MVDNDNNLVGGWPTPLKNDGVSSSVGMMKFHSQLFMESHKNSMVPVTTKQLKISTTPSAFGTGHVLGYHQRCQHQLNHVRRSLMISCGKHRQWKNMVKHEFYTMHGWLVVSTPLKHMKVSWAYYPNILEKTCSKPPTRWGCQCIFLEKQDIKKIRSNMKNFKKNTLQVRTQVRHSPNPTKRLCLNKMFCHCAARSCSSAELQRGSRNFVLAVMPIGE